MHLSKSIVLPALLIAAGPALAFPEIVPQAWRVSVVTLLVAAAASATIVSLNHIKGIRAGLWLFVLMLLAGWVANRPFDAKGISHFAGAGLGLLTMATVASVAASTRHLQLATLGFTGGACLILVAGLLSTSVNTGKYFGLLRALPLAFVDSLPGIKLGLPGMGPAGTVNPNALGGTALLLLPSSLGAAAGSRRRRIIFAVALTAVTLGALALIVSRSRSAVAAALVTVVLLATFILWRRRGFVAALVLAAALGGYQVATFDNGARCLRHSIAQRTAIWNHATARLAEAPIFGIGMSQFHDLGPEASPAPPQVAHAHNVFMQTALDIGLPGLAGYLLLFGVIVRESYGAARRRGATGWIAAGAGLSLVAVHVFGLTDAIALGAKVGLFQWYAAGLILAASRLASAPDPAH